MTDNDQLKAAMTLLSEIRQWNLAAAVYLPKPTPAQLFNLPDGFRRRIDEILKNEVKE